MPDPQSLLIQIISSGDCPKEGWFSLQAECFPGRAQAHGPGLQQPLLRDKTLTIMTRSLLLEKYLPSYLSFSLSGPLSFFSIQLKLYPKFTAFIIAE